MKNGGAEQCLLTAAEDGEILPREAFSPRSTVFMVARQGGQSCSPREAWEEDSKQLNCFPELRRQPVRCSKPAPAPAPQVLHPGAGTRKVAKKFGSRSTLCGSFWHPARLHRPPPAARRVFFWILRSCASLGLGFPTHIDVVDAARELPCSGPPRMRNWANHTLHQRTFSAWVYG